MDTAPLGEDVTLHTMLGIYRHIDGRSCSYHARLGKWATTNDNGSFVLACLRHHKAAQKINGRPLTWFQETIYDDGTRAGSEPQWGFYDNWLVFVEKGGIVREYIVDADSWREANDIAKERFNNDLQG